MRASLQWLLKSFLKGLLLVVPLTVTAWVFYFVFIKIDGLLGIAVPGLGFLFTLLLIVAVGAVGSIILVDRAVAWLEHLVSRVPFAKLIYFPLKDFVGAFVGDKKSFRQPVLVSLGNAGSAGAADKGVRVLGFVTAENLEVAGEPDLVAVYLPQAYNFAGNLILVPRDRVIPLPPEESSKWLAFTVSGGISRGTEVSKPVP
jgi:uncharacterized membrane protein